MREISVFDIIGPIMIGPSSSHTAGALRIAQVARKFAGGDIVYVRFRLYGSFAKTYRGHGTDRALVGGILGFTTSDYRIRDSLDIARAQGLEVEWDICEENLPEIHPNTADILMRTSKGKETEVRGVSIGGGAVEIVRVNGVKIRFTGEYNALFVTQNDKPGVIAHICTVLEKNKINIAYMRVYREEKGSLAYSVLEIDGGVDKSVIAELEKQNDICSVRYLEK